MLSRLQRFKSGDKSGERIDFKFSLIQVIKVPKGCEKLFISVISSETGKTIAKSNKSPVRDGICQWNETIAESIWISQGESPKNSEDRVYKFIVATGSSRSAILGEATINLIEYMNSKTAVPISIPLKKCTHDTVLKLNLQILTPKTRFSAENDHNQQLPSIDSATSDNNDVEDTNGLNRTSSGGVESSSNISPAYFDRRKMSSSSMLSPTSSISEGSLAEIPLGTNGDSPASWQELEPSRSNSSVPGYYEDQYRSNSSSFSSSETGLGGNAENFVHDSSELSSPQGAALSSFRSNESPRGGIPESNETILKELRSEASMWERTAKKLKRELVSVRKELSEQAERYASIETEVSEVRAERDSLYMEVQDLKIVVMSKEKSLGNDLEMQIAELKEEIDFQKESNSNLIIQLTKTQESNIDLISGIQELEETIEMQKQEITQLLARPVEHSSQDEDERGVTARAVNEPEDHVKIEESNNLTIQVQALLESQNELQSIIRSLQKTIDDKNKEIEAEKRLKSEFVLKTEVDWSSKLASKEDKIIKLEAKVKELNNIAAENLVTSNTKLQESEGPYTISTEVGGRHVRETFPVGDLDPEKAREETMELISGLMEQLNQISTLANASWCTGDNSEETSDSLKQIPSNCHDMLLHIKGAVELLNRIQELHRSLICYNRQKPGLWACDSAEPKVHTSNYSSLDECAGVGSDMKSGQLHEKDDLREDGVRELEAKLCLQIKEIDSLQQSKTYLATQLEKVQKAKECLEDSLRNKLIDSAFEDSAVLYSIADSNNRDTDSLNVRLVELGNVKEELEAQLSQMEEENIQLSERISGLEAQVRYLTEERESTRLTLENFKSHVSDLENEKLSVETEFSKLNAELEVKLREAQLQISASQDAEELSKRAQSRLQERVDSLVKEHEAVYELNAELRRQRLELYENCESLEGKFRVMQDNFSILLENVETLETKLNSVQQEISLKENAFSYEAEALIMQNNELEEKLRNSESLQNEIHSDLKFQIQSLDSKAEVLRSHLSDSETGEEKMSSKAVMEISSLRADKKKLELSLEETNEKLKTYEIQLHAFQGESKTKEDELRGMLASSQQNEQHVVLELDRVQNMFQETKLSEKNSKRMLHELEAKVRAAEHERQQLLEEIDGLSNQLQKTAHLKDEIFALKSSLEDMTFEKGRLEASLKSITAGHDDLKTERESLVQKISSMQKTASEADKDKRTRDALEEKLLRLEGDLAAKEALRNHESELRNELNRMKRANSQFQRKIQLLEKERDEQLRRVCSLEDELKRKVHVQQWEEKEIVVGSNTHNSNEAEVDVKDVDILYEETSNSEVEVECSGIYENGTDPLTKMDLSGRESVINGSPIRKKQEADTSRLSSDNCETTSDLTDASETDNLHKTQSRSHSSPHLDRVNASFSRNPGALEEVLNELEQYKLKTSSLETDLGEMHEKYFDMSLKFAELQAQREELVLELKSLRNGKTV